MTSARHLRAVGAPPAPAGAVSVFADLRVDTDAHRLHLVGDGRSLVLHSSDPLRFAATLRQVPLPAGSAATGRRAVGRAANTLRDNGITLSVRGPDGVIVQLGAGPDSRLGRLLTGSPAVTIGTPRDLAVAAGVPVRAVRAVLLSGLAVAGVAAVVRAVRRH